MIFQIIQTMLEGFEPTTCLNTAFTKQVWCIKGGDMTYTFVKQLATA